MQITKEGFPVSNRIFQSVIVQLKEATDRVLGVIDAEGNVVSCTDTSVLGDRWADGGVQFIGKI